MDIQILRNLTTGKLHTEMSDVYKAFEFFTGDKGIMTHQIPIALRAITPLLKKKITQDKFWDGKYDVEHKGNYAIAPLNETERDEFYKMIHCGRSQTNHKEL